LQGRSTVGSIQGGIMGTAAAATPSQVYDIRFEHRPHDLYVRVFGDEQSYEIGLDYWRRIVAMLQHRHYTRVLVDKDFPQALTLAASHLIISQLAQSRCQQTKVAIVDRNYDEDLSHFEEMVAVSRGLSIKYFQDLDSAEKWLGH